MADFSGDAPDIGAAESAVDIREQAVWLYTIHFFLWLFSREYSIARDTILQSRENRFLDRADSGGLKRRFAETLNVFKPDILTTEEYRKLLQDQLQAFLLAPAEIALDLPTKRIFGVLPLIISYFEERGWILAGDGDYAGHVEVDSPPSLDVIWGYTEFQLRREWFRIDTATGFGSTGGPLAVADDDVTFLFCDGDRNAAFEAIVKQTTDITTIPSPAFVFAKITAAAGAITLIEFSGFLDVDALIRTFLEYGHGFEVEIPVTGINIDGTDDRAAYVKNVYKRSTPSHKLGLVGFTDDRSPPNFDII